MFKWKWENKDKIKYITLPDWTQKGVINAFSSRQGGASKAPFASLNLGLHVGDNQETVLENRRGFLESLSADLKHLVCCQQIHGNQVAVVGEADAGRGALAVDTSLPGCDAMITKTPGLWLAAFYADCIPLLFFDPVQRAVGVCHSGWKGTMGRIAASTVHAFKEKFNSQPQDLWVFIGPGIDKCCFQIQPDLAENVVREFEQFDDIILSKEQGVFWDLKKTNQQVLIESGVNAENICICEFCTSCNLDIFYSYRGEKGNTGRMAAVIGLKY